MSVQKTAQHQNPGVAASLKSFAYMLAGSSRLTRFEKTDFSKYPVNGYGVDTDQKKEKVQIAIRLLKKSVEIKPNCSAFHRLSFAHLLLGNYKEAINAGHEAEKLVPTSTFALENLSIVHKPHSALSLAYGSRWNVTRNSQDHIMYQKYAKLSFSCGDAGPSMPIMV